MDYGAQEIGAWGNTLFFPSSSSPFLYRHRTKGAAMRCDAMLLFGLAVPERRILGPRFEKSKRCEKLHRHQKEKTLQSLRPTRKWQGWTRWVELELSLQSPWNGNPNPSQRHVRRIATILPSRTYHRGKQGKETDGLFPVV